MLSCLAAKNQFAFYLHMGKLQSTTVIVLYEQYYNGNSIIRISGVLDMSINLRQFEMKILIVLSFLHAYSFGVIVLNLPNETPMFLAPFRFEVY